MLYDQNSVLIATVLFVLILLANEGGYRAGRHRNAKNDDGSKTQTNAIQGAMLGLLALLLGFTFTMSLQRFDARSQAVMEEANAIGTAWLRTGLLPETHAGDARELLEEYVDLRLRAAAIDVTRAEERQAAAREANRLHGELWDVALRASEEDPRPVTSGLFIQSLNELIDVYGARNAALRKHVPEIVLLSLFAVFIIGGSVLGYAGGLAGARPLVATVAMSVLIVLVIFIIIDLDRPRRGLIQVNQDSMLDLGASVHEAAARERRAVRLRLRGPVAA